MIHLTEIKISDDISDRNLKFEMIYPPKLKFEIIYPTEIKISDDVFTKIKI